MQALRDPAQIRVGINLASSEDEAGAAKVAASLNDVLGRFMNLSRLVIVASPVVIQSCWLHSVDLGSWLFRLASIYALIGVLCAVVAPEQAFNGMALREFRWLFEWLYPEAAHWNGSPALESSDSLASKSALVARGDGAAALSELSGLLVRLRLHGTDRYLCLSPDGWFSPGDESFAATLLLQHVDIKGERAPDTYTLRVRSAGGRWDEHWLTCTSVNQLRLGGWLVAVPDASEACPYKLVQDSVCPVAACKMLCAWPSPPQVAVRRKGAASDCAGFYLAEQRADGRIFVGHSPDSDASLLELMIVRDASVSLK
ncbi:unnamed protein product [Polarella glacialis]|uniref:Uncharacterized protein n=1 Tax=Polarella glacialis TaxID=89957 RepID=A0A813I7D5_POLGL|nr:unnamed protein product [Polarella glacialis]